jgi:hypothetical protein
MKSTIVKVACGLFVAGVGTFILVASRHRTMTYSDYTAAVVTVLAGAGILLRESIKYYKRQQAAPPSAGTP